MTKALSDGVTAPRAALLRLSREEDGADCMTKWRSTGRARILVPLFIGFLVMAVAFILISYYEFRTYTIEDCVNC